MDMTQRRPLTTTYTRLRDIPPEWLQLIEPKIVRAGFEPCWVWCGGISRDGYAQMVDPTTGKQMLAHVFVARLYWDFPEKWYVGRICDTMNCLNPSHLVPQERHPRFHPPVRSLGKIAV